MINPAMMPQIAALLSQRQQQQMQQAQKPPAYYGTIPEIAEARKNDPRQLLANTALANGTSTDPVAQGGWAWADGIARALQGGLGGYINKQNDKRFGKREQDVTAALAKTAELASTPQPQAPPPQMSAPQPQQAPAGLAQAAQALAPASQADLAPPPGLAAQRPSAPMQSFTPPASAAAGPSMVGIGGGGPQGAGTPLSAAQPPPRAVSPMPASARSPAGSQASRGAGTAGVSTLFRQGIVSQEGVQNRDGTWKTSFKGAVGPAQIMPATGPEAARLAGLPWDEKLFKANTPEAAEYNLKLGEAYYAKQLETFGDPLKAAAAYNAGPGAVQRAERRARAKGGEWTDYLPVTRDAKGNVVDSTAKYVERFAERGGGGASVSDGTTTRSVSGFSGPAGEIPVIGAIDVMRPEYETGVPDIGRGDYVPPEVQSNRIAMAQQMLQSGNPDLVVMARAYLDQGLTEQNQARVLRSEQQFNMGRDDRSYDVQNIRDVASRNFGRESNFVQDTNASREAAAGRAQNVGITAAGQRFERDERIQSERFTADQNEMDREITRAAATAKSNGWMDKDPFWTTPTGEKIRETMRADGMAMDEVLNLVSTFQQYNEETATGGIRKYTAGVEGTFGNSNLSNMDSTAKQLVLKLLGGLGVAISDGDRNFVTDSILSTGATKEANDRNAEIIRSMAYRKKEYNREFLRWRAENGPRSEYEFEELWDQYKNSNPIILRGKDAKGKATVKLNDKAPSFTKWVRSIPFEDGN